MPSRMRRRLRAVVWSVVGISAVAPGGAWCVDRGYVQPERQSHVDAWRVRLDTMADDRARAVQNWLDDAEDRLAAVAELTSVRAAALDEPGADPDPPGPEHLQAVLAAMSQDRGSVGTWVLGSHDAVLASVGTPPDGAVEVAKDLAARARSERRTVVEFRRIAGAAYVVLATPFAVDAQETPPGAVVRVLDPAVRLFPAVAAVASTVSSIDSFLVGLDGDDIVYLSPVGLSDVAPMAMRVPFGSAAVPARNAVTSSGGFGAFEDLRGAPVLAATRRIAGTDWGLVVKVDESEVYAPFFDEIRNLTYLALASLAAMLGVGFGAWRRQRGAAAAALARSEARFASLIEHANDPILVVAHDGRILRVNPRAASFYGRSAAELCAMTAADLRPPESRGSTERDRDRVAQSGGLVFETVHVRADGTRVPVEVSARPLEADGERVYVSIIRDVTERHALDAALLASEERERARAGDLQAILDALPVAVVITHDRACRKVDGNHLACSFLGLPAGSELTVPETAPTPFRSAVDGRPLSNAELPLAVAARHGTEVNGFEMDVVRADGTPRRLIVNARPLRHSDGSVRGAVAAFIDVTEHRRVQGEVDVLWRAIDQAPVSVVITDHAGDIEYVNPRFCEVTGYSFGEVAGKNPRVLQSGSTPREEYAALWDCITSGRTWSGEFQNRRKDGSLYWESAVISPVLDESGRTTHFVAVKEDITARKAQEAALHSIEGELLQSQKMEAVGRLAGGVAHDFNNLLSVIMGYTELTLGQFGRDDPRRRGLEEVRDAADRAGGLTRQLLAFSRKQVVEPRILDLGEVVSATTKMLGRLVGEDVLLDVRRGEDAAIVRADVGMIEQVVMNLVVNARDAMPCGGRVEVATRVENVVPGAERHHDVGPGRWVVLSVRDTGVGIPPEIRDKIFEPFFTTKEAGKGTGLGLPTVYGIVRQSGGVVRFDSEVGTGTVFEVYLPRIEGTAAGTPAVRTPAAGNGTGTILLVEDEPALRNLARILLTENGYVVLDAENANVAVGIAATHVGPIDLLLTDVVMPGAPGPDLAELLAPRITDGRVLYMSGYTEHPMLQGAEVRAGTRLLRKPFTGELLRCAVASALQN